MTDRHPAGQDQGSRPDSEAGAFRAIFDANASYVVHTLRRLGVRPRDLDEATHDTFLVVHRRLAEWDRARPIRPWIGGIAYRVASDYRRRTQRRPEAPLDDPEALADPRPRADVELEARERREMLAEALEAVPLERRVVLVMHDVDGTAMSEIADALGIPANTGYSRLRTARAELAAAYKRARLRQGQP